VATEEDAWAIQHEVPFVDATAAFATSRVTLVHRNKNWITVLNAISRSSAISHSRAMQEIRAVLRQRHGLQPDQDDDFVVQDLTETTRAQQNTSRVLSMLLAAIAWSPC
jgi:hypothetical protein